MKERFPFLASSVLLISPRQTPTPVPLPAAFTRRVHTCTPLSQPCVPLVSQSQPFVIVRFVIVCPPSVNMPLGVASKVQHEEDATFFFLLSRWCCFVFRCLLIRHSRHSACELRLELCHRSRVILQLLRGARGVSGSLVRHALNDASHIIHVAPQKELDDASDDSRYIIYFASIC